MSSTSWLNADKLPTAAEAQAMYNASHGVATLAEQQLLALKATTARMRTGPRIKATQPAFCACMDHPAPGVVCNCLTPTQKASVQRLLAKLPSLTVNCNPTPQDYGHLEEAAWGTIIDLSDELDAATAKVTIDLVEEPDTPCYTPRDDFFVDTLVARNEELKAHNARLIETVEQLERDRDITEEAYEAIVHGSAEEAREIESHRRHQNKKIYELSAKVTALERRNDADVEELNYNRQLVDEQRIKRHEDIVLLKAEREVHLYALRRNERKILELERLLKQRSDRLARIEAEYESEIRAMDNGFAERILSDSDAARMTAAELYGELKRRDATIERLKGTIKSFKQPRRADRLKTKQPSFK